MSNGAGAWKGGVLRSLVLGVVIVYMPPANAAAGQPENVQASVAPRHAARHPEAGNLDARIGALAKALDLDASQETQLRRLLLEQRDEVARIWRDSSVPAAYRVNSTRFVSDKTADKIRAMLTEEQKKKFNPPQQPHAAMADSASRSVEEWMSATRAK